MSSIELFEQQQSEEIGTLKAAVRDIENAESIMNDEATKSVPGIEYSPLTTLGTVLTTLEGDLEISYDNGEVSKEAYEAAQTKIEEISSKIDEARKNHIFYDREAEVPLFKELMSELGKIKPLLEDELTHKKNAS